MSSRNLSAGNSFKDAGNPQVVDLWEKEQNGAPVTESAKQIAIVNSIPFPVGIHLQKLICPTSGSEDEGYDEFGLKRLGQIAQLYETIIEFFSIIMIAQLWEIFVRYPGKFTPVRQMVSPGVADIVVRHHHGHMANPREIVHGILVGNVGRASHDVEDGAVEFL